MFNRRLRHSYFHGKRDGSGFELVDRNRAERAFIFRCTHFDEETRRCDSYESRPGMCRDYPRVLLEQANPEFFPDCGFKPLAANRQDFVQILDTQSLTSGQMRKLKQELYLED